MTEAGALPTAKPKVSPAATVMCHLSAYRFSGRITSGTAWFSFAKFSIAMACTSIASKKGTCKAAASSRRFGGSASEHSRRKVDYGQSWLFFL